MSAPLVLSLRLYECLLENSAQVVFFPVILPSDRGFPCGGKHFARQSPSCWGEAETLSAGCQDNR